MFSCPLCGKKLKHKGTLESHIRSHIKEKPHKCPTCSASFGFGTALKNHIKSVHDGLKIIKKKNVQCNLCDFKCSDSHRLKVHLGKHSSDRPFPCSISGCDYKAKYENNLQQHLRGFHSQDRPYKCPSQGCNYKGKNMKYLNCNLQRHNTEKPFACEFPGCNYASNRKSLLASHISKTHDDEKPWKCSSCDFRAKHRFLLKSHQDMHSNVKRFQCQVSNCSFASNRKSSIVMHFDRKHRTKDVSCTAVGCNFKCASAAVLNRHRKVHQLPILKCPHESCNFSARFKDKLLKHVSRRHGDLQPGSLVMARKPDPPIVAPAAGVEEFHCSFPNCDYQTDFPHRYDRHILKHDEKHKWKHVCTLCSSRFIDVSALSTHVSRHTREKPYSCSYCAYACVNEQGLRYHARRVHNILVIPRDERKQYDRKCRTCDGSFSANCELVLHSTRHLQAVVALERLRIHLM